jgi:hypothetical protein
VHPRNIGCGDFGGAWDQVAEALRGQAASERLDRRRAMHDIRTLFAGLGDLRTELTLLGRYLLTVLDEETQLLQIAARTPTERSARLDDAYAALVDGLCTELADWLKGWAANIGQQDAATIAAIGVNALLGKRATRTLFHATGADISDDRYIPEWTAMLACRIQELR